MWLFSETIKLPETRWILDRFVSPIRDNIFTGYLSVDSKIIKHDEQKISHKSCQINLLTEKCNSNDKKINVYNNLNDYIIDQSNKTKEISTQTEHQQNSIDEELLNNTSCDNVLASKNTKQKNAKAKINWKIS